MIRLPSLPLPMRAMRALVVLKRAVSYFIRDDGAALAGYMAYTALLCLFPFLIFATALAGLMIGPEGLGQVLGFLFRYVPEHVAKTIQPVVVEVVANRSGNVLGLSALGAIYIASNGFEALRVALERAYATSAYRPWWKNRLIAVAFVLVGVVAFIALALLIVLGPSIAALARSYEVLGETQLDLWLVVRYLAAALILGALLVAIHWFLPGKRPGVPIFRGVAFTMVMWLALASAFSIYFRLAPSYAITYGTLGGVIATLLFFYVSAAIFIFGAEINSAAGAGEDRQNAPKPEDDGRDAAPVI